MPPRHAYWTIILDGKPTAFRAHAAEELEPTLRQLRNRHPDARMVWFARGRLWESPETEREARFRRDSERERRGPDWRPGGAHRDPRDRFKVPRDEKRRRFAQRMRQRPADQGRETRDQRPSGTNYGRPEGGQNRARGKAHGSPRGGRPAGQRASGAGRRDDRQRGFRRDGPRGGGRKPGGGGRRGGGGSSR